MKKISFLIMLFVLTGCDAINCIVNNHPEFSKNSVAPATLNQVFDDSISVSISNSFEDSEYLYSISLDGKLPEGISIDISSREIVFSGTPIELGEFPFRLSVLASPWPQYAYEDASDAPEDLCSDTENREMVFVVAQGI